MTTSAPVLPPIAVRVGVTGHRDIAEDDADLVAQVNTVLTLVRDVAIEVTRAVGAQLGHETPILRIVSPLAEGADRVVASCGLALNASGQRFELHCPLPRPRDSYRLDFEGTDSVAAFDELLDNAAAVFELEPDASDASNDAGYERVGRTVLRQSDVLIAVWDESRTGARGGTAQIASEAESLEVPVVVISPRAPARCEVRFVDEHGTRQVTDLNGLRTRLTKTLTPPAPPKFPEAGDTLTDILREPRRFPVHVPLYRWFRAVFLAGKRPPPESPETPTSPLYGWANARANLYGQRYRNSFVANYLLGAVAVLFGAWSYAVHAVAFAELLVIVLILAITLMGQRRRWHEQWIRYRLLAEQLRQLDVLRALGRVPPSFRIPVAAASDDPRNLVVSWVFRAEARVRGLPHARLNRAYLTMQRDALVDLVTSQLRYHRGAHDTSYTLHHRLHFVGSVLFALTLLACVLHVAPELIAHLTHEPLEAIHDRIGVSEARWNAVLTFCAVVLPAFGGALAAINMQGEFGRQERRSASVITHHERLLDELNALRDASLTVDALGQVAEQIAELMTSETLDWQIVFRGRPLTLPA